MRRFDYLSQHDKLTANPEIIRLLCELHERNAEIRLLSKIRPRLATSFRRIASSHNFRHFRSLWRSGITAAQKESSKILRELSERPCGQTPYRMMSPAKSYDWMLFTYRHIETRIYENNSISQTTGLHEDDLKSADLHAETVDRCINEDKDGLAVVEEYLNLSSIECRVRFPESVSQSFVSKMCKGFNDSITVRGRTVFPILLIPCFLLDYGYVTTKLRGIRQADHLLLMFLLERFGFVCGRYESLERVFETKHEEEINAFESGIENWQSGENNYEPYVLFFLNTVLDVSKRLSTRMKSDLEKRPHRDKRIQGRVKHIEDIIRSNPDGVPKNKIFESFPEVSTKTIERDLYDMLKTNKIARNFIGRTVVFKFIENNVKFDDVTKCNEKLFGKNMKDCKLDSIYINKDLKSYFHNPMLGQVKPPKENQSADSDSGKKTEVE